ncbi:MAG: alpha/beta hydrolase [Thermodesulfobacteriota bacterium]|nr:alpha/beta hydrolase [Thermodesulfobacteriota bacterium]
MQLFIKITTWTFLIYFAYCCFLFVMQRQIIFPRSHIPYLAGAEKIIPGLEKIWLTTPSGKVETWFMPPLNINPSKTIPAKPVPSKPAPAVIFGHGNAELIDFCPEELKEFTRIGIGVLLIEYPGYGRSEGSPSQKSISHAFNAGYDYLVSRKDVDPNRIILFGRSVGGGAVCALASNKPSAALILQSAFTSVRSFASRFLAPGFLVRDPFDNLSVVSAYTGPVLIIHGKYDDIIPFSHGKALYKKVRNGKMIAYDCSHNDCPPDYVIFWKDIETFLNEVGIIT